MKKFVLFTIINIIIISFVAVNINYRVSKAYSDLSLWSSEVTAFKGYLVIYHNNVKELDFETFKHYAEEHLKYEISIVSKLEKFVKQMEILNKR